jgi:F-type H+-transporting ATPase subunit gamma
MSLEQTQQHRKAIKTIHDIVSAMRAIAAGRIQSAQRALANARRYQAIITQSLSSLRPETPIIPLSHSNHHPMLLVLTSEQPFCGSFNQEVLALAEKHWQMMREAGKVHFVIVGQRGKLLMASRGISPEEFIPATTSLKGLRNLVKTLTTLVDEHYTQGQLSELRVIYNRYRSISEQQTMAEKLLPLDLSKITENSLKNDESYHYLSAPELVAGLVSEYVFINLYRIATESFTSEQASRLVAMDGATRNTEKVWRSLIDLERRERQDQITRQVLELIAERFAIA